MPSIFESGLIPTQGTHNADPSDSVELATDTIGAVVTVTTAGTLTVNFHGSDLDIVYSLALGTIELRGNFRKIKATGSTAVLAGGAGAKLVIQRYRAYKLKH